MRWKLTATVVALALLETACGGVAESTGGEEPDEVPTPKPEALTRTIDPEKMQLSITASGIAFDTDRLVAPADEPFQIVLDNQDDLEHNVAVFETISGVPVFRHPLFRGELLRGPVQIVYDVDPLPKGRYIFYCDAHIAEKMKGDFIVR